MRVLLLVAATAFVFIQDVDIAQAQQRGRNAAYSNPGTCPVGTCSTNGGKKAKNLNKCSASNCGIKK